MQRFCSTVGTAVLSGVLCLALGCSEATGADPVCGDDVCEQDEACDEDCQPCDYDGQCDPGEEWLPACPDCGGSCGIVGAGPTHDVIVSELYYPWSTTDAQQNGVDLDGDGDIDNKLGLVTGMIESSEDYDRNVFLNGEIAAGRLVLLGRIRESGDDDGLVRVQLLLGELLDATPLFDGTDRAVILDDVDPTRSLCGAWDAPELSTSFGALELSFPVLSESLVRINLSRAQVRTVDDPSSDFAHSSEATDSGWTDVMVGGGLSQTEVYDHVVPQFWQHITDLMAADASSASIIGDMFDGACEPSDIPGCEDVVAGEGECDNTADPPVITVTDVMCNPLMNSALAPDVDSDGDGERDLFSLGFRIVSAVPVTIVEQ